MRWLLDLHEDFPGSELVRQRLVERGTPPIILTRQDVLMGRWPKLDEPAVGYGTMHTMTRLGRVTPGAVFDDYAKLRCSSYYRFVYDLLGRRAVFAPFRALPDVAKLFGGPVFVRSDTNYKLFPASVVDDPEGWLATYVEHADELVVIAEPTKLEREYRCFVRDGAFACGSSYSTESPLGPYDSVPSDVRSFAEAAAKRLELRTLTVDVATGDRLRIVEVGGVNSWGIYGSNVDDFIAMMEAEASFLAEGA